MKRMGWSYGEFSLLPAGYLPVLVTILKDEDRARRQANRRK